jgi:hypothetical protein
MSLSVQTSIEVSSATPAILNKNKWPNIFLKKYNNDKKNKKGEFKPSATGSSWVIRRATCRRGDALCLPLVRANPRLLPRKRTRHVNAPGGDRFVSAEFASTTQWATAKALAYYRTARRRGMPLVKASSNPSAPEENLICFQTVMYTFFYLKYHYSI